MKSKGQPPLLKLQSGWQMPCPRKAVQWNPVWHWVDAQGSVQVLSQGGKKQGETRQMWSAGQPPLLKLQSGWQTPWPERPLIHLKPVSQLMFSHGFIQILRGGVQGSWKQSSLKTTQLSCGAQPPLLMPQSSTQNANPKPGTQRNPSMQGFSLHGSK